MTKVNIGSGLGGAWLDKSKLTNSDIVKIITEAQYVPSQKGGDQLVAKVRVKGSTDEAKNFAINKPSQRALVEMYGDDSAAWVGHTFGIYVEKTRVGGQAGWAAYLIPEGYEAGDDDAGYLVVRKVGSGPSTAAPAAPTGGAEDTAIEYPEEEINPEDIPF